MASYKVPQDVEADDKLIGPFSFRQFIYLVVAILGIALAWGFSRLFIPLAIIPLPIVIFFGALALPLRKDQPMEIYLAAVVSFFLKPRKRIWKPDGIQSLVEVVAPKVADVQRTKTFSGSEAEQRLSYLADLVDTRGWSVRGVAAQPGIQSPLNEDAYIEAQDAPDVLDEAGGVAQNFDTMISTANTRRHEEMMQRMTHPVDAQQPQQQNQVVIPPPSDPYANLGAPNAPNSQYQAPQQPVAQQTPPPAPQADPNEPHLNYSPYPAMHQSMIDPNGNRTQQAAPAESAPSATPEVTTSGNTVSPDIMNLANNSDLSIETIAHEAKRIQDKETKSLDDEVVISLH